jgi:hypothetical protein
MRSLTGLDGFRRSATTLIAVVLIAGIGSVMSSTAARAATPNDEVDVPVGGSPLSGITTTPLTLIPDFAASIHDYVLRCQPGVNRITITLTATAGGSIQVAYQSGGTVTISVNLGESQAAVILATDPSNPSGPQAQYWIRCLPHDFPQLQVSTPGTVPPGWYFTGNITTSTTGPSSSPYAMILDQDGTPVWYQTAPGGAIDVEPLPSNTVAWIPLVGPGIGADPNGAYHLFELSTQTASALSAPIPPTDPHELLQMDSGDRMMIATPLKSGVDLSPLGPNFSGINTLVDCLLEEVNSAGALVWQWRMSDHVGVDEANITPMLAAKPVNVNGQMVADVYHCNSVDIDSSTGDVLVSARNTSALYLINKASTQNQIVWKLGGTISNKDNAQILTISNDPESRFSGQHDARFQPSGDVSVYDDHTAMPGAARGVEYALNIPAGTATVAWQYASPDGLNVGATGSFRRYSNGLDNLIGWGFKAGSGFTEVDGSGSVLMNLTFPNGELEYRVVKAPPASLDINMLRETAGLPRPVAPTVKWESLGGVLTSKPAVASWGNGRMDVFVRGTDSQLWHKWWNGTQWIGWEPLGGVLASGPAVASWGTGRLDVFVRGTDNQLWHKWWDGTHWLGWEPLGGVLASGPAVASWGTNRLDVTVEGTDKGVWHKWWDGAGWSGWESQGGQASGDPAMSSWGTGRLDVFIANPDGTLGHRWYDGGQWTGWEWFAGAVSGGLSAASSAQGQVDVVSVEPRSVPQRFEYSGGWQNWQSLGGLTTEAPAIVALSPGTEDVFLAGTDSGLWLGVLSTGLQPSVASSSSPGQFSRADVARL